MRSLLKFQQNKNRYPSYGLHIIHMGGRDISISSGIGIATLKNGIIEHRYIVGIKLLSIYISLNRTILFSTVADEYGVPKAIKWLKDQKWQYESPEYKL